MKQRGSAQARKRFPATDATRSQIRATFPTDTQEQEEPTIPDQHARIERASESFPTEARSATRTTAASNTRVMRAHTVPDQQAHKARAHHSRPDESSLLSVPDQHATGSAHRYRSTGDKTSQLVHNRMRAHRSRQDKDVPRFPSNTRQDAFASFPDVRARFLTKPRRTRAVPDRTGRVRACGSRLTR